ncbi:hypothetical protein MHYP_G00066000 [Metynnis hypsauchen]
MSLLTPPRALLRRLRFDTDFREHDESLLDKRDEEDEREEKVKKVRFAGSVQVLRGVLRSAYLLLFSGPPNQYIPFPQLPAMPR